MMLTLKGMHHEKQYYCHYLPSSGWVSQSHEKCLPSLYSKIYSKPSLHIISEA